MTRILAVIPARMGSSRFPGKPLAPLLGRPMIEHVYRRTAACAIVNDVIVATCDEEIVRAVKTFGGRAVMTSAKHARASDRVAEASKQEQAEIIVMVQGDEPMIHPEMIAAAVAPLLAEPDLGCVNLVAPIWTVEGARDPNTIKVVVACNGNALFFSREPIPTLWNRPFVRGAWCKQVCVIPFRRSLLERFATLPPTPLEAAESIDMLRLLEHGIPVRMVPTDVETQSVDTPRDLEIVAAMLACDPFTATYP
jgi:3-deoxy-manno-octulosonate cytidylyltransferase (CMP-KDO synthetase)